MSMQSAADSSSTAPVIETTHPQSIGTVGHQPDQTIVDFWFDPACPWAWLTSRWMLEVEQVRPVKVVFHVMSLAVLNESSATSPDYRRSLDRSWAAARVARGVERDYGPEQLSAFYTAIGTRFHPQAEPRTQETIEKALADVGLPTQLAALGDTATWDDDLRASHHRGMDPVGYEVGTPVIHVGNTAWFGPVVTPRPTGEDAGRLFDAVLTLAGFPGFYELKRTRTEGPDFSEESRSA
jgi:Mycothiol-dependent nitroreductase Rv2466c